MEEINGTNFEVSDLTKTFEDRKRENFSAVDHVSFHVMPGQTLGIVGESGSGKVRWPDFCAVWRSRTEARFPCAAKRSGKKNEKKSRGLPEIQWFSGSGQLFRPAPDAGGRDRGSLRNAGVPRKEAEKRVRQLLEQCGLPEEFAKRYPHEVSGGQCQRAAIARALAIEPQILICDEATSALDVAVQKQIMELLDLLRKEKHLTILFICHNLALVQSFCDRILVMKQGKMVEEGTPEEVIWHPKHPYTKLLVDSVL